MPLQVDGSQALGISSMSGALHQPHHTLGKRSLCLSRYVAWTATMHAHRPFGLQWRTWWHCCTPGKPIGGWEKQT
jgi:hypothetical protein